MTKLEKLVNMGVLKNNEEIYLHYKGEVYTGIIINDGRKIRTRFGEYKSLSSASSALMLSNPNCARKIKTKNGEAPNNGAVWWRNWNYVQIGELFKRHLK